ncbi:nuclear condensing complex subunit [Pholiota molesta]|nr:nuclear condensing complex subunit [Pholiota molesta]
MAPPPTLDDLYESVANIFEQAQGSLANHKKNCVALFKIHTKAAEVTQAAKNGNGVKLVGEKAFQEVFMDMASRVLQLKKGPANADRIVKYVGAFVKFMNEKGVYQSEESDEDEEETSTTRFVARLLNWLLQGFIAKNKNIRYRCIHIVSEMISHLGEIDEDVYNELRGALMDRLNDKETLIRAHAVIALSKLIGNILQTLLEVISTDPAAYRHSRPILSRTRDVDPVTRKLVYASVLQPKLGHPRQLSIAQREQVVKDGLGDREAGVRVAAGKLVASWFDAVLAEAQTADAQGSWEGDDGGVMKGLVRFLGLFDVVGPGGLLRPDVPDVFIFSDGFWKDLSPESAVLARVFVEHCTSAKNEEAYNSLIEVLQEIETAKLLRAGLDDQEVDEELEEELAKREIVMNELLQIMRKVFSVEIMPSERDLIRVIVEIVVELREGDDDAENADEPPLDDNQSDVSQATIRRDKSARRPKSREEIQSTLEGILGDLIIPSVKRKELAMREKALVSLGLCCLIAKNMALNSFQLFLSQAQNSPPELKVQVLRIIMDLLIMYDQEFFGRSEETATKILDFLLQILEAEESPEAQAVIVTGLCKLLLAGMITEPRVLTCLALLYISPTTVDHQEVRQCLSYFFPVYAYSSATNQNRMQSIFMPTFDLAVRMHEDLEEDQEMIAPYQFGLLMVDWTNPQKAAEIAVNDTEALLSHVNLAAEILVGLYDSDRTPPRPTAPEHGLDNRSILKLNILLSHHEEVHIDRFKNRFLKMFDKELKEIDPLQYLDDELRDLYQRIGVDVPEEGEDGQIRPRSREDEEDDEEEKDEEEGVEEEEEEQQAVQEEQALDEAMIEDPPEETDTDNNAEQEVDTPDEESRKSSVTPPPKRSTRKSAARKAPPKPKAKTKTRKTQQDSESQASDEENIPPAVALTATPKKKKGVKRDDPPSDAIKSPANRKRTRVKAPLKPAPKDVTPTNTDVEESPPSPTPTKPGRQVQGRQTRSRGAKTNGRKAPVRAPPPPEICEDEDVDDADEVASSLASQRSTPDRRAVAASSDDFGGYSID